MLFLPGFRCSHRTVSQGPRPCRHHAERRKNRLSRAAAMPARRWETEKPSLKGRGDAGTTLRDGKTVSQGPRRCRLDAERRKNRLSRATAMPAPRW